MNQEEKKKKKKKKKKNHYSEPRAGVTHLPKAVP